MGEESQGSNHDPEHFPPSSILFWVRLAESFSTFLIILYPSQDVARPPVVSTCVTLPVLVFPKVGSNFYAASGWCPHTAPRSHVLQTARSSSCPPPYQGSTRASDSITRTSESTFICPESPSLVLNLSTTRTAPPASSEARAPKSWGRCIHQPQHFPDEEAAKFKARLSAPCKRFGQEKRHLHAGLLITRLKKQRQKRQKSSTKSSFGFTNHMR